MPLPIKCRYTIAEAAKVIARACGEPVSIGQVLDWGAQGLFHLYAPLVRGIVQRTGETDVIRINDVAVEVRLSTGQAASLANGERIGVSQCWHDGIECKFMRQKVSGFVGWRTDTFSFGATALVLMGAELEVFTAGIAKPTAAPAADTAQPAAAPSGTPEKDKLPLPSKDWGESARAIADECFDRDTANNCRDSLKSYSSRVMNEMQKQGIKGPRGLIDNPNTIQREALQGARWWAGKQK